MKTPLRALPAAALLALGLTACGGGGGGHDTKSTSSTGVLVDDVVMDATVFCDSNGNGTLDVGEATTTTNDNGVYTFTPACSAAIVSVAGTGTDKTLSKAPKGVLRSHRGSAVVSLITTLWVESGLSQDDFKAVLARLGLSDVDPATFNPATDGARTGVAAALAKMLNEITDIAEDAGADPAAAYKAALKAMVAYAQAASGTGSLLADDTSIAALASAAATAAFALTDSTVLDSAARANAASIVSAGVVELVNAIKTKTSYSDAHDDLNSAYVRGIVWDTDLHDSTGVSEARDRCRDSDARKPQYVYTAGDVFTIVDGAGAVGQYSLAAFDAGLDFSSTTLGALQRLELPLRATTLGLNKKGERIALALEVEQSDGSRLLQVAIDRVKLTRDSSTGVLSASIASNAKLYFYARSASGIEIGTGKTAFTSLDSSLLTSTADGISLDLQALATKMKGRFPNDTELLDKLLNAKGTFKVTLVVGELDLRHADGSRFDKDRVSVKIPADSRHSAYRLHGTAVQGQLTF